MTETNIANRRSQLDGEEVITMLTACAEGCDQDYGNGRWVCRKCRT